MTWKDIVDAWYTLRARSEAKCKRCGGRQRIWEINETHPGEPALPVACPDCRAGDGPRVPSEERGPK